MSARYVMPCATLLARMDCGEVPHGVDHHRRGHYTETVWHCGPDRCGRAVFKLVRDGVLRIVPAAGAGYNVERAK